MIAFRDSDESYQLGVDLSAGPDESASVILNDIDPLEQPYHLFQQPPHMPPPEATLTILSMNVVAVACLPDGTVMLVPRPRDDETDDDWLKRCWLLARCWGATH